MKVLTVIQARLGSTRLPGKVLMKIEGKTVLQHTIERVRASKKAGRIVVATTIKEEDLKIVKLCAGLGVSVYCGSEDDVLDRYYQAAKIIKADPVVRITSDCPLIDPEVIDRVIGFYFRTKQDYATNTFPPTYPDGQDVEVFSFSALKRAWKESRLASEREHVSLYIRNHPELFKITNLKYRQDLSRKRWTLDRYEDYKFIKTVYRPLYRKNRIFGMNEVLNFLKKHPELEQLNQHISRSEGHIRALASDRVVRGSEEQ